MRTPGQRARICATMRATSSTAPAEASMLAQRCLAASRCEPQKMYSGKIAIAVVIAVKEAPFLMPVQRVVGGVEVEDDLLWRLLMRLEKEIDKQRFDLGASQA